MSLDLFTRWSQTAGAQCAESSEGRQRTIFPAWIRIYRNLVAINNNSVVICAVIDPQTGQYVERVRKESVCSGVEPCVCVCVCVLNLLVLNIKGCTFVAELRKKRVRLFFAWHHLLVICSISVIKDLQSFYLSK